MLIGDESGDRIRMHAGAWNADPSILREADRIILCSPDEAENRRILSDLRRLFCAAGDICLRAVHALDGLRDGKIHIYGQPQEIYTPELILSDSLNDAARRLHGIFVERAKREGTGGPSAVPWEELSDFSQRSNIAAADHMIQNVWILSGDDTICALTPENCAREAEMFMRCRREDKERLEELRRTEHVRWTRFHLLHNWQYAEVRDNAARKHPLLVPYERLTEEERARDDGPYEILAQMRELL